MEKRLNRISDWYYYFGALPMLSWLPPRAGYALARWLGRHVSGNLANSRELIVRNLQESLAFSPGEAENTARRFFEILACEDLDGFWLRAWHSGNIDRFFAFEGLEHLEHAVAQGRGGILMTAHVGAVCSGLVALGSRGFPVTHVTREYENDHRLYAPFRAYGARKISWVEQKVGRSLVAVLSKGDARNQSSASGVLQILSALSENVLVSMALDVLPEMTRETEVVDFLGLGCRFTTNIVQLAHSCRVPVIPYFVLRDEPPGWRQKLLVRPPIELSGHMREDLQRCVAELEWVVRRYPSQWFSWDSLDHFRAGSTVSGR